MNDLKIVHKVSINKSGENVEKKILLLENLKNKDNLKSFKSEMFLEVPGPGTRPAEYFFTM